MGKIQGDESFSIITDYLGTPCQMYNDRGRKTWECELDIYGKIRYLKSNRSFNFRQTEDEKRKECPFRYQGQYEDTETGLYYNRFRYYDPEDGNYISHDPIKLEGNNLNFYSYVSDVNNEIDKFGLMPSWMPTRQGFQRHHIIPKSLQNHPLFKSSNLNIDGATNMKYLPVADGIDPNPNKSLHLGWNDEHANYNKIMKSRLDRLENLARKQNWDQKKIQSEVLNLQHKTRAELDSGKLKCH